MAAPRGADAGGGHGGRDAAYDHRTIKARYVNGTIVPLEPIDGMEEGEEIVLSLEDPVHATEEEEDEALGRAIAEGLRSEPVSRERVFEILRGGG